MNEILRKKSVNLGKFKTPIRYLLLDRAPKFGGERTPLLDGVLKLFRVLGRDGVLGGKAGSTANAQVRVRVGQLGHEKLQVERLLGGKKGKTVR